MDVDKEYLLHLLRQKDTIAWNAWRENSFGIKVDLSNLDLKGLSLATIEVCGENPEEPGVVFHANLSRVDLRGADFGEAKFPYADLRFSDLRNSNGEKAQLLKADLRAADLSKANLRQVSLHQANLSGAKLTGTGLSEADLSEANLTDCDLEGAFLFRAELTETNFTNANLYQVHFAGAWLTRANFRGANLCEANLTAVQAGGANFTGANLTGACIESWNPDSETILDDVTCDYIYLKNEQQDRRPSSGNFAPGEFMLLFQKALDTVDLIFADGIDWKAFFQSFQELRSRYGDENIAIQAIEKKSGGSFVIRLEVAPELDKAAIHNQAEELYEKELKLLGERVTEYKDEVRFLRQCNTDLTGIVQTMAYKENSKVTQHFNAPVTAVAGNVEGNQIIYSPEQRQTLAEAAAEIQELLDQLSQTYPTNTTTGKMQLAAVAIAQIENNPTLMQRVLSAIQAGGTAALEQFLNHPAASFVIGAIADWKQTKEN